MSWGATCGRRRRATSQTSRGRFLAAIRRAATISWRSKSVRRTRRSARGHDAHHDEVHAAMSLSVSLLQVFPLGLGIFMAVSAATAAWVMQDARARFPGGPGEGWVWAIGSFVALPIFLPLYLIAARPVGRVMICPSCGRGMLSHRATCLHCGHPIIFEAFPETWGLGEVIGVATVFMVSLPVIAQAVGVEEMPTARSEE